MESHCAKFFRFPSAALCSGFARARSAAIAVMILATAALAFAQQPSFFDADGAFLPAQVWDISTVPTNGDVNPYGVVFIAGGFSVGSGPLHPGDILISNFNNSSNLQGTGTTIVDISKAGVRTLFFQGTATLGLTTALGTLRAGFVVVGNGPTSDGTSATATAGSLLVINNQGSLVQTITSPAINYPWDMTLVDNGSTAIAFVANALDGKVNRLDFAVNSKGLTLQSWQTIASYAHQGDPVTLFDAPTGSAYDPFHDKLYVASTLDNAVYAIDHAAARKTSAGQGELIYKDNVHLHGPLGMAWAPNGHLLVSNNDAINPDPNRPSEIVEFTVWGQFVREISVDPAQGGSFGLAVYTTHSGSIFAAVDDNTASLFRWNLTNDLF
jgi:DNA-binding beta-propeller fold protein YncE